MSNNSTLITLPAGIARFPALCRPDTKFNPEGTYKTGIVVSKEVAQPVISRLQAIAKTHTGKVLPASDNALWQVETDDDGNETGNVIFKTSVKNKTNSKTGKIWDRKPLLIDAKKNPLGDDVNPWGGSVLRVQVEVYTSEYSGKKYISLQPVVVQVIELKSGEGTKGDLSDFDEEDGYEVSNAGNLSDFDSSSDTDADDEY